MDINVSEGATVWFKQHLKGDIVIEYNAIIMVSGGI